uniref:UBC core domain-containing protein n=1 Tax=Setaria viridis TaxID=4556 RepID=A0A4U6VLL8_SETVI|nr:probable ubiquitin-conjugating enzyme E2 33 isoform X1 [Setaria viridis]TKW28529.1 hypothetical protein SEVIR_3G333900v2 [Setaria viridis]
MLCKELPLQIVARSLPNDILEWHYVLEGSKGIPFEGRDHAILYNMITPSGRFAPHKRICLLMSDFHLESWNPMWSVARYAHIDN